MTYIIFFVAIIVVVWIALKYESLTSFKLLSYVGIFFAGVAAIYGLVSFHEVISRVGKIEENLKELREMNQTILAGVNQLHQTSKILYSLSFVQSSQSRPIENAPRYLSADNTLPGQVYLPQKSLNSINAILQDKSLNDSGKAQAIMPYLEIKN